MSSLELVTALTTGLALALACAMGAALVRVLREERRRSDARIAALIDAAGDGGMELAADERTFRTKAEPTQIPRVVKTEATARRKPLNADAAAVDLHLRPAPEVAGVSEMFAERDRESPWGRRVAVAACVAAIVAAAGYALLSRGPTMTDGRALGVTEAAQAAPLELLSLRHAQQRDKLTITGLVQNPRTGAALSRVTATAFLFAADGTFLASGRAPLDFLTIGPGEESPFVVSVPVTGAVARYRVGFRGEDGRVIAHVDRRANGTMALRN